MATFVKKPIIVQAVQFVVTDDLLARFAAGEIDSVEGFPVQHHDQYGYFLEIKTNEGTMRAHDGDWIITGVKGEKYPCRKDIFAATYEPAVEGPIKIEVSLREIPSMDKPVATIVRHGKEKLALLTKSGEWVEFIGAIALTDDMVHPTDNLS